MFSIETTNPYLRKQALKKEMVERFVTSSSAIEGIHVKDHKKSVNGNKTIKCKNKA